MKVEDYYYVTDLKKSVFSILVIYARYVTDIIIYSFVWLRIMDVL